MAASSAWAATATETNDSTTTDTLTVYTYSSFASDWGPGPAIEKAFEAQCSCNLEFVALDDGVSILNRLRLEGSSTKADILLGLDNNLISEAKKTGLLTTHKVDTSNVTLPNGWSDDTFVPYDYGYFAFVYDSEKLATPPNSLAELVERDDLSVIYQDPRTSTPGQGLMLWMKSVYGDKATDAWQQLAKKNGHCHQGLVGSLQHVSKRRVRSGTVIYDFTGLSHHCRQREQVQSRQLQRRPLHAG